MKKSKYQIRHITISALFIALGICLPIIFHGIPNGGQMLLPMHIPAMLAAFFLPAGFAVAVGFLTPLLSSLLTGMPPIAPVPIAFIMSFEIGTYALVISLLRKAVFRRKRFISPLIAVLPALVIGRLMSALIVLVLSSLLGFGMLQPITYVWSAAVTGIPGIIAQIILIPLLYQVMVRAIPGWNGQDEVMVRNRRTNSKKMKSN